jgi:hypothetical protein
MLLLDPLETLSRRHPLDSVDVHELPGSDILGQENP